MFISISLKRSFRDFTSNLRRAFPAFFRTENYRRVWNSKYCFQIFESLQHLIFLEEQGASLKEQ